MNTKTKQLKEATDGMKKEFVKEALRLAIEALEEHKDESTLPRIKELLFGVVL